MPKQSLYVVEPSLSVQEIINLTLALFGPCTCRKINVDLLVQGSSFCTHYIF